MSFRVQGVSAYVLAAGLIAACRIHNVPPLDVFDGRVMESRRSRATVANALHVSAPQRRKQGVTAAFAELLKLRGTDVAPSARAKAGITTDHMLVVVEAMKSAGLVLSDVRVGPADELTEQQPISAAAPERSAPPAGPALVRGEIKNVFDPKKLTGGRRPAPKVTGSKPNARDVNCDAPGAGKPFDLGTADAVLVAECLRQGGFPVIFEFKTGAGETKIFWLNPQGQNWKHRR